jgi:hypothetical protein
MIQKTYSSTARLVPNADVPETPFDNPRGVNWRNKIWWELRAYVKQHPEGMPVWKFRETARGVARGVKGDMDIDIYLDRGLAELVDG